MGILANSIDPDEMQHNAAFHQGLHCLLKTKPVLKERTAIILGGIITSDPSIQWTMVTLLFSG